MTNVVKTKRTTTWWAAGTTKDRMDANDSYESSEKHSLKRCVLLLFYHYGFYSCSFCNISKNCDFHTFAKNDSCFVFRGVLRKFACVQEIISSAAKDVFGET